VGTVFVSHSEKDITTISEIIRGLEQAGYHTWYFVPAKTWGGGGE